ncbi:MAG TPA: O-antigen ligase family protein [Verrucomicrobiae bacterium]
MIGESETSVEAGSAVDRNFLTALIIPGFLVLLKRNLSWESVCKNNKWFVLLFLYMGISILWSDYPWVSFKRWIKVSGAVIMALVLITELRPREALEAVLRRSTYVLIPFSFVLVKYFTGLGVYYNRWTGQSEWVGVTMQKNGLGRLCLVSGLFLFWVFTRRRAQGAPLKTKIAFKQELILLAVTFWLLHGCDSKTSMVILIIGCMLVYSLFFSNELAKLRLTRKVGGVIIGLVIIVGYFFTYQNLPSFGVSYLGRDASFTGRTDIWNELFPIAWQNAVLGLGYGSFWIDRVILVPGLNEGHSGYLDVVLEVGVVGLLLLLFSFRDFYKKVCREIKVDFPWFAFGLTYLLLFMSHNLTETSFIRTTAHLWTVFVFLYFVYPLTYLKGSPMDASNDALTDFQPIDSGSGLASSPVSA